MPETWDEAVKNIVVDHGDAISLQGICSVMLHHPLVTPHHREAWRLGKQPRYECWIRRSLTNLVRQGDVRRVSRGLYISN